MVGFAGTATVGPIFQTLAAKEGGVTVKTLNVVALNIVLMLTLCAVARAQSSEVRWKNFVFGTSGTFARFTSGAWTPVPPPPFSLSRNLGFLCKEGFCILDQTIIIRQLLPASPLSMRRPPL